MLLPTVRRGRRFLISAAVLLTLGVHARSADAQDRFCDASFEDCRSPLIQLIRNETSRIDVAFWYMTDARYANELIRRWQAGVDVRIIVDPRADAAHSGNDATLQALRDAGIPMRQKNGGGILHWKMMLFDAQNVVEFSGANYSPYGFVPVDPYRDYQDEVIVFLDGLASPSLVNSFRTEYEDLWTNTSAYSDYANIAGPLLRHYPVYPTDPELNIPPTDNFRTRSVAAYDAETERIDAQMFRITDRAHTDGLIRAAMRGVPVRLLSDNTEYRNVDRLWHAWNVDRLYMAGLAAKSLGLPGIDIQLDAHANVMHQKSTLLYSQGLTIFGSSNWTSPSAGGSSGSQQEHNWFTTRTDVFTYFLENFERKWNSTNPIGAIESAPFEPLRPDTPTLVSPANGATGVGTSAELTWNAGPWGHLYDIYLGTDSSALQPIAVDVELGPTESATDFQRFTVGGLNGGTQYFWRVVSKTMARQSRTSATRSFTTGGTPSSQPALPAPWAGVNVGAPTAGSASAAGGTFTVSGAGADIYDTSDAFYFVYQPLTGDGTLTARVVSQQNTDVWAKAGVMMRNSLDTHAAHASLFVTPGKGVAFQRRAVAGGASTSTSGPSSAAPYWVRLVRQGNTFSAFASADGVNWTLIGTDTIVMGATIQVGLPVNSHEAGELNTTTFDSVSLVEGSGTPGITLVRQPYLQQVTSTSAIVVWATAQPGPAEVQYWIGAGAPSSVAATTTHFPASTTGLATDYYQHEARVDGLSPATEYTYDIFVGGADATGGTDRLTTAPATGSGTVRFIAFGDSGTGSSQQHAVAAAMRADTFDFAVHTGDMVYGNSGGTGTATFGTMNDWFFAVYQDWLRVRPMFPVPGNHDSRAENNHGVPYLASFVLPENGASTTYPDHAERYYSFDYGPVHVVALDSELAFQDSARRAEQLAWLQADLSSTTQPWKVAVVHRPPYSSGMEHGSDTAIRAAFGPLFEQHGVQLVLTGHDHDYERTLPLREGDSGQRVAYVVTGGGGAPLYPVGASSWTAFSASAHHYVRLTADSCDLTIEAVGTAGTVFDAAALSVCAAPDTTAPTVSITAPADGADVSGTVSVAAGAADDVGVAKVGFYVDGALAATDFAAPFEFAWNTTTVADGVHTLVARAYDAAGNERTSSPVSVNTSSALPGGWASTDVGAVGPAGSAGHSGGTFTVTGSGADVWGTADAFHFAYRQMTGDGEIVARVATVEFVDRWTKAGVMMRASLTAGSAHGFMLVSPDKGLAFQRRTATGGISTHTGTAGRAPYFVKLVRTGNTIAASVSTNGTTWVPVGSDTIPMPETIYVGLAVSSHVASQLATATFDTVAVTDSTPAPDTTAPATSITAPADGATVTGSVSVTADATDNTGVTRVELWVDGALALTDTTAPYTFAWDTTTLTDGAHTLQTRAYDAADNTGTSATVTVQVDNTPEPDTTAPATSITAPADGATVTGSVSVTADATDNTGVARVELWVDGALALTDTTAPYAFAWDTTTLTDGAHTLQTRAYDAADNTGTSSTVTVQVSNGGTGGSLPAPWQSTDIGNLTAAGSAAVSGGTFTVEGAGADIWDNADAFHFVYRPLTGNGEIVARVATVENVHAWTKAAVMMRETLDAGSKHAMMLVSSGKGLAFQRRRSTNGSSVSTSGGAGTAPAWVKLVRIGQSITAFRSADGVTWTQVGSDTIAMGSTIQVGLAVTSHFTGTVAEATFDNVAIETAELPAGWSNQDVGAVGLAGSAGESGGTFTLEGSGADVWGTADQFHYGYRTLSGDGEIVARVATIENTSSWTKVGVMMRETLDAGSSHAFMLVSSGKGLAFQRRTLAGGVSTHTSGGAGTAPRWVRLVRSGSSFSAYASTNGTSWTLVGTETIGMGSTIYVGVAVSSHTNATLCTATVDSVTVTGGS
jgi:regulation of enolase protein 1 (concanavalin A-like superfamily)